MLTVQDFVDLLIDAGSQTIAICDLDKNAENVFVGCADDIPSEYQNQDVSSIDTLYEATNVITLNICSSDNSIDLLIEETGNVHNFKSLTELNHFINK